MMAAIVEDLTEEIIIYIGHYYLHTPRLCVILLCGRHG